MKKAAAYLGLGSNLGNRHHNLQQAIKLLSDKMCIQKISSVYETDPVGFTNQPKFLNAVCKVITTLAPEELLLEAKGIEQQLGRKATFRNGPRVIDIDLLLYANKRIKTAQLEIPHPRMTQRAFVLVPLAEIAPNVVHPTMRKRVSTLVRELNTRGVVKLPIGLEMYQRAHKASFDCGAPIIPQIK